MKDKLKEIIDHLKLKKVDYGDARYVFNTNQSISVKDQTVEALSQNEDMGVGIRVIVDGCWGFASTSSSAIMSLQLGSFSIRSMIAGFSASVKKR